MGRGTKTTDLARNWCFDWRTEYRRDCAFVVITGDCRERDLNDSIVLDMVLGPRVGPNRWLNIAMVLNTLIFEALRLELSLIMKREAIL